MLLNKPVHILRNNGYMMKLAWKTSPSWVVHNSICNAIDQFGWVFETIIFMRMIVGGLARGAGFTEMLGIIAMLMVVNASINAYQKWFYNKYAPEAAVRSYEKLNAMLFDQSANTDLTSFEDPTFYNDYTLAIKEASDRMENVISSVSDMVVLPITLGYVVYQMLLIDPILLFLAIFPLIGTCVFDKAVHYLRYRQTLDNATNNRKKAYVNRILYLPQYAKEIRLSNVLRILNRQYNEGHEGTMTLFKKYGKLIFPLSYFRDMFSHTIVFCGVFLYGAYRVIVSQTIDMGEFVILYGAMLTVTMMLNYISETIMSCNKNALYIQNLRSFLEYKPAIPEDHSGDSIHQFDKELVLRNVSFAYKGSEIKSLRNINMKIKRGEKVAIVGHNGAGKSTLIKLLLRFYDPTAGEVLLDGNNIKTYNLQDYRRLYSVAFQDQCIFSMSVAGNVSSNRDQAIQAMKRSGIWDRVQSMPKKEYSTLTREFDSEGVMLSGGEIQKISIARIFARTYDIGIFDEPSSALDPVAEYKLFDSMKNGFKDKTIIFISHRLSSARLADRIFLLDNGVILEEGSHEELMKQDGTYAEMFNIQAEKYTENEYAFIEGGMA